MVLAKELDIKGDTILSPNYDYVQVLPLSTTTIPLTIPAAGSAPPVRFECDSSVFNLSKSYLEFTVNLPQPASKAAYLHINGMTMINRITLRTKAGLVLCDVPYLDIYLASISRYMNKIEDVITWDKATDLNIGVANQQAKSDNVYFNGLACNNSVTPTSTLRSDGKTLTTIVTEPSYVVAASGTLQPIVMNVKFPFRLIHDTIFAYNKDIYFGGQAVAIEIQFNQLNLFGFLATAETSPDTGNSPLLLPITLSNMSIRMAKESNLLAYNMIVDEVVNGRFTIDMPFYNGYVSNMSGSSHNPSNIYNGINGQLLKKIYWVALPTSRANNLAFSHNNLSTGSPPTAAMITSFQSVLDSTALQNNILVCSNGDDYMRLKDSIRGSCIQSASEYYYNWVWIDSWQYTQPRFTTPFDVEGVPEENLRQGLPLLKDYRYTVNATCNGAQNLDHYFFALTTKTLTIGPNQITIL